MRINRGFSQGVLAAALLVTAVSWARADKIDDFVKEQMRTGNIPGVAIGIVRDGKLETTRGYGLANVELNSPVTKDTVFEIGSMTKQFTAALTLLLVEDGKVGLDDKISKYLADIPETWKEITIQRLLTHTSGIPGYTEVAPDFLSLARNPHTQKEIVKLVADKPLAFQPGEKWAYSNTGYYLLGMIIEKAGGKPYIDLLTERILKPLGMSVTRDGDPAAVIPNRSAGYLWQGKVMNAPALQPTAAFSAGCLVSTVSDLAKWDAALAGDRLLKSSSRAEMWTPVKLNKGNPYGYGFGWMIGQSGGHKLVEHAGGTAGFATLITRYLDEKITIVVLTNRQGGDVMRIGRGLAAMEPTLGAKPVEDKDLPLTTKLKAIVLSSADNKMDPTLFTAEARAAIFPDKAAQAAPAIASLGKLRSFTLQSDATQAGVTQRRYRAEYEKATVAYTFAIMADGKIAGFGLGPE